MSDTTVTLVTDETQVETTLGEMKEAVEVITQSLLIKGLYRGITHKEVEKRMQYVVKLRVEHELDRALVHETIKARTCMVTYRVPAVSSETVQLDGVIDSARPDDGEGIWLKRIDPGYVTFAIHHVANGAAAEMARLLALLKMPDLAVEARFVPLQGRLL